jgi:hypothetical protein
MKEIMLRIVYFLAFWLSTSVAYTDIPCQWRSKTGATFGKSDSTSLLTILA